MFPSYGLLVSIRNYGCGFSYHAWHSTPLRQFAPSWAICTNPPLSPTTAPCKVTISLESNPYRHAKTPLAVAIGKGFLRLLQWLRLRSIAREFRGVKLKKLGNCLLVLGITTVIGRQNLLPNGKLKLTLQFPEQPTFTVGFFVLRPLKMDHKKKQQKRVNFHTVCDDGRLPPIGNAEKWRFQALAWKGHFLGLSKPQRGAVGI